jgi:hypothetical protein
MTLGIFAETRENLGVHAGDSLRRIQQTIAVGILADGDEDLADGGRDSRQINWGQRRTLLARRMMSGDSSADEAPKPSSEGRIGDQ